MPELPEVETVARDLRPRLVGATIVGARSSWARTLRTHAPDAFAAEVAGRTVEAVGRRAKLVVVELSGSAALTIHLKMTGQLFVVPADLPEDPYVRLVLELADGRELRFRDIRKFGRVGLYPRDAPTGDLLTEPGGARSSPATGRSRSTRRSPCAPSGPGCGAARAGSSRSCSTRASSPGSATSTPTRRSGRPGCTRSVGELAAAGRRAPPVRGHPGDPGRGRRAARLVDRRLHRAGRRRRDAGAPQRLPADRRAVPALRPADPPDRHRRPSQPLLLVVPAPVGGGSQGRAAGSWRP